MSSHNRHPRLKRRTPSPPPSPPSRRERGEKSSKHHHTHDDSPSHSASAHGDSYPTTLLVRNLSQSTRPEDLRIHFENFGPVEDVYLPKNYHTGITFGLQQMLRAELLEQIYLRRPACYGFVKYRNAEDAAEAKHHMNNQTICGHQISVVFSKEDAKRPEQMLAKEHNS